MLSAVVIALAVTGTADAASEALDDNHRYDAVTRIGAAIQRGAAGEPSELAALFHPDARFMAGPIPAPWSFSRFSAAMKERECVFLRSVPAAQVTDAMRARNAPARSGPIGPGLVFYCAKMGGFPTFDFVLKERRISEVHLAEFVRATPGPNN
jgi:hypothetical protein